MINFDIRSQKCTLDGKTICGEKLIKSCIYLIFILIIFVIKKYCNVTGVGYWNNNSNRNLHQEMNLVQ